MVMALALRPTTERHGTEPPNVTIDQMLDNLNLFFDKRLGLKKCHRDMCQRHNIKGVNQMVHTVMAFFPLHGTPRLGTVQNGTARLGSLFHGSLAV